MAAALSGGAAKGRLTAADRYVLRMALGATLAFALAMMLHWTFSFLAPMLTIKMLAAMPTSPRLRQGLVIPLVIFASTTLALVAATYLHGTPLVLMAILGLVLCASFYAQRRGAPRIVTLLVQISFCMVPLYSSVSLEVAQDMAELLQKSSVAAIGIVWLCHALVPALPPSSAPDGPPPPPPGLQPMPAIRAAASDILVLLPLLVALMLGERTGSLVALVTTINVLNELDAAADIRVALTRLLATALGGALAVVVQQFVLTSDTLIEFFLAVFVPGLWFARGMQRGGPAAVPFSLAFSTYLLLLGIAVTPLPGGSEESFALRLVRVSASGLYALGLIALLGRLRRSAD